MTSEESLELAIKPFDIFFAVSWASSPVAPNGRENFQLANTRAHIRYLIFRILGTA